MPSEPIARKIVRKSLRILSEIIPYNTKYKPAGIINVSRDKSPDDIEFIELNPPSRMTLDLREEFIKDCSPYAKPIITIDYPGDYIIGIPGGRVYSYDASNMAVISNANNLIEQVSFQWSNDVVLSGEHNILFKKRMFLSPRHYNGKVFSLLAGGGAITYYYHWLFDAMPKLGLLKKAGIFDQIDYFLVPNCFYKFQKEYLGYFGIPPSKIINGEREKHIRAEKLYVASYVRVDDHHPKWTTDFLYNSFVKLQDKERRNKRIYITRRDAGINRKVINEGELIDMLKTYGFEIHNLTELSVIDQAKLFNCAEVVVGSHGGGLSNLVYCESGTKMLEIFPDKYVRHIFYDICNKRGIKYSYVLCRSDGTATNNVDGQKLNLIADVDIIEEKLKLLLSS